MINRFLHSSTAQMLSIEKKLHHPAPVLMLLIFGSFFVAGAATLLLLVSFFVEGNYYVLGRLLACSLLFAYVALAFYMAQRTRYGVAATMLIVMYVGIAAIILWYWGIHATVGMLLMSFVIVLAGVMLGARYIIYTALGAIVLLVLLQLALQFELVTPDTSSLANVSGYGDVATYAAIFLIFSLVAWIAGRKMELSLAAARQAEAELSEEKLHLEKRVAKQAEILRQAQLEEMEQLYRFAELGQMSTLLLHELANNLAVLTLDIDDLHKRHRQSVSINRAKESITHLEVLVDQVRHHVKHSSDAPTSLFSVTQSVEAAIASVQLKAASSGVEIQFEDTRIHATARGNQQRLTQVVAVLLSNAIDAYSTSKQTARRVDVRLQHRKNKIIIQVVDSGVGISKQKQKLLFAPMKSSKPHGMGIGLYIAREITRMYLNGSLSCSVHRGTTIFSIELPTHDSGGGNNEKTQRPKRT